MNLINDLIEFPFIQYAFLSIIFLTIACGIISPFIIVKKSAFMGAAISHSALLGVAISLSIVGINHLWGIYAITGAVTMILAMFLAYATFRQKIPSDGLIGIFFTTTMGLGMIVHHQFADGQGDLLSYLFGNILLLTSFDVFLAAAILILTTLTIIPFYRYWIYFSFDEEMASTQGVRTHLLHFVFYFLITFIIVSSLKIAGTVLINTLLLVPGVFALKFSRNTKNMVLSSTLFSLITGILSFVIANQLEWPIGATLCVFQFLCLLAVLLFLKLK
tara:strand:- start:27049 stop:27873 length:825 start_codon:yes stop_codon:yes gene_type:complete